MAKSDSGSPKMVSDPWRTGSDASYVEPRFIPDYELMARDDSGGPAWDPRTAVFGDGGNPVGAKAHLSARGGSDDPKTGTEQTRNRNKKGEG